MSSECQERFVTGLEVLRPFLESLDYRLETVLDAEEPGTCRARFNDGRRSIFLTHDEGLRLVVYSIGRFSIEHTAYLDALGVRLGAAFPPLDPAEGYSALLLDLQDLLVPFFEFPDRDFIEIAQLHGGAAPSWP